MRRLTRQQNSNFAINTYNENLVILIKFHLCGARQGNEKHNILYVEFINMSSLTRDLDFHVLPQM